MKTLSLSEAFEQATKGPLTFKLGAWGRDKRPTFDIEAPTQTRDLGPINICAGGGDGAQPLEIQRQQCEANAALLAHCFNHMQETARVMEMIELDLRHNVGNRTTMANLLRETIAKLNQVQIP